MKKTTKILSGTLLVALMSLGLATKVNARNTNLEVRDVLTQDMTKPVTGKVVRRAADEEAANKISVVKAQVSAENEGKRHIRFVAGLDSVNYADAKFDIVAKDGEATVKRFNDLAVTTAYTHIEAAGEVLSAADAFGEGYNYLMAYTIKNVPADAWNYEFEVVASVKTEEATEWTTTEVATKVINEVADKDEVGINYKNITSSIEMLYNGDVEETDDLLEGIKEGKKIIGVLEDSTVYTGFKASLGREYNLKNETISFYVSTVSNVRRDRVTLSLFHGEEYQIQIFLPQGSGTGYKVEPLGNTWYYVEIDVDKAWRYESYTTDHIEFVIGNQDSSAVCEFIIADVKVTLGTVEEVNNDFPNYDWSKDLIITYSASVTPDTTTSIDGESMHVSINNDNPNGAVHINPSLDLTGYMLSFYIKFDGTTVYKDRTTLSFRTAAGVKVLDGIHVGPKYPQTGATITQVNDGWYYIEIDCDAFGASGQELAMIRFVFQHADLNTATASAWLDQITIVKK